MKRVLLASAVMALTLTGCGETASDNTDDSKTPEAKTPEAKAQTFEEKAYEYAREQIETAKEDDEAGITANEDLARTFHAEYEVHVDASRTMTVEVAGIFQPVTSVEDADAGKADIETITSGIVSATNTSDGRAIEDFTHSLTIQMSGPELCGKQPTCTHELSEISVALLEPGETFADIALGDAIFQPVGGGDVKEDEAENAAKAISEGILIAEKTSVFGGDYLKVNTDVCKGNRAIFWAEDRAAINC